MSIEKELMVNRRLFTQLRRNRRNVFELVAARFEHAPKVATLLVMLQAKWKLGPQEIAKVALAAAYVLVGDARVFDQVVDGVRDRADPFAARGREREIR